MPDDPSSAWPADPRDSQPGDPAFGVGDPVEKIGGDYTFVGIVRSVFAKQSGAVRYVVEDERGILMIYSRKNLVPRGTTDA